MSKRLPKRPPVNLHSHFGEKSKAPLPRERCDDMPFVYYQGRLIAPWPRGPLHFLDETRLLAVLSRVDGPTRTARQCRCRPRIRAVGWPDGVRTARPTWRGGRRSPCPADPPGLYPADGTSRRQTGKKTPNTVSPIETVSKRGHPKSPVIAKLMRVGKCSRATAFRKQKQKRLRNRTLRERLEDDRREFSPIIKPSDNWNISPVLYSRIDDADGYGYIPGELYCNCLWYFTKPGDLVVAPMAGSGMIQHVYNDRSLWMKSQPWDLDLRMFDLTPRGRYKPLISAWDMLRGFPPVERAPDYVVMDVPYFSCVRGQYSSRPDDIANMDEAGWTSAMADIAASCASVEAKLCTVIVANYVDKETCDVVLCAEIVCDVWKAAGYKLFRVAYASKHIQIGLADAKGTHADRMPVLNNRAKRTRTPLNDIAEVLTFSWMGGG